MRTPAKALFMSALAIVVAAGCGSEAMAKTKKKPRPKASTEEVMPLQRDSDGTPIIMQGYSRRSTVPAEGQRRADRPARARRGSSTYIPPVNPSPGSLNSPPAASLSAPIVQPYKPPPITTFSDRVNSAIQAYPLERGIGNNPVDQQQFIRQRLNQP